MIAFWTKSDHFLFCQGIRWSSGQTPNYFSREINGSKLVPFLTASKSTGKIEMLELPNEIHVDCIVAGSDGVEACPDAPS
jgi:hypothetical protein